MTTCRLCLRHLQTLHFKTERMAVCGRCVHELNRKPELAEVAQERIADMLRRGMLRRATTDLDAPEEWKRRKAVATLEHIDEAHQRALPAWVTRLLRDPENTSRDFMLMRAYRRGLLHYDRPKGWGYPLRWSDVAARIRRLDGNRCLRCGCNDKPLDVHHIVYVSNFGTHQQSNLVTLCRPCHEQEHGRSFDFGEAAGDMLPPEVAASPSSSPPLAEDRAVEATRCFTRLQQGAGGSAEAEPLGPWTACTSCGHVFRDSSPSLGRAHDLSCPKCGNLMRISANGTILLASADSPRSDLLDAARRDESASADQQKQLERMRAVQAEVQAARPTIGSQSAANTRASVPWTAPQRLAALAFALMAGWGLAYVQSPLLGAALMALCWACWRIVHRQAGKSNDEK